MIVYCRKKGGFKNWLKNLFSCNCIKSNNKVQDKSAKSHAAAAAAKNNKRQSIRPVLGDPNEPAFLATMNKLDKSGNDDKSDQLDASHLTAMALANGHKESFIDLDDG